MCHVTLAAKVSQGILQSCFFFILWIESWILIVDFILLIDVKSKYFIINI